MSVVSVVGLVGAVLSMTITLPQFLLVWRTRNVDGIALSQWVIFIGSNTAWFSHGIITHAPAQIYPNLVAFSITCYVLYQMRLAGRWTSPVTILPGVGLGVGLISLDLLLGSAWFGMVVVIPSCFGMIRQAIEVARAESVGGVSITMWVLNTVNNVIWLWWGLLVGDPGTLIASAVNGIFCVVVLGLRLYRAMGHGPILSPVKSFAV